MRRVIVLLLSLMILSGCTDDSGTDITIIGTSEDCSMGEGTAYLYVNDERIKEIPESEECNEFNNPYFSFEVTHPFNDGDTYEIKFTKEDKTVVCNGEITAEDIEAGETQC